MKNILLICISCLLFGCSKPNKSTASLVDDLKIDKSLLVVATKQLFTERSSFVNFTAGLRFKDTLLTFYSERNFEPVWALSLVNDSICNKLLTLLRQCRYEGLHQSYYRLDSISNLQQSIQSLKGEGLYQALAKLELLVTDNMLSYHRDRVLGRTEPRAVFGNTYQLPKRLYPDFKLFEILNQSTYQEVLKKNAHMDLAYNQLCNLLVSYYQRVESGESWFSIDTVGITKIEPGDSTAIMPRVAKKLYLMGVINAQELNLSDPSYYNPEFVPMIRRFQAGYGLQDDGILGRKTFGLLNVSLQDRIDQISANLERIRWFETPAEKPFITVNLPAFELEIWWPDSVKSMRVCIGKPRPYDYDKKYELYKKHMKYWLKPADYETPQISSSISYMVINPTWTVPKSIITREMYSKMVNDPFYLSRNDYGVFYKGKEIRSDKINWRNYSPNNIPFDIVQQAGEANALGKIKFIFPNPFQIYLHDTPQKLKFQLSDRAISHGCVRVENPLMLGEFLMQNHGKYTSDDFRIWMGYPPLDPERLKNYDPLDSTANIRPITKTNVVSLQKSVPVFFLYNTIWFNEKGEVQYRNDVYDKNKYILWAMKF